MNMWETHYFCVACDTRLSWHEKMQSHGTCPYCGKCSGDTIVDVKIRPAKWVTEYRPSFFKRLFGVRERGRWEYHRSESIETTSTFT